MIDTLTIGGSEAAAACGLDPYRSRVELWLQHTGRVEPPDESEAMYWGTALEPAIAASVERHGYAVLPAPAEGFAEGHMHAHLDGFVAPGGLALVESPTSTGRGVLEIKTASVYRAWEWDETKSDPPHIPLAYQLQALHYMAVTGLEWALVACLLGGQRLVLRTVERDDRAIAMLRDQEAEFLDLVRSDTPPAPDGSDSADAMLKMLYPDAAPGSLVELTSEDYAAVQEIKQRREALKASEAQLAEVEQALKMRLGEGETGVFQGRKVCSYRSAVSHRLDGTRLREELPEIAAEYVKASSYRTLRVMA